MLIAFFLGGGQAGRGLVDGQRLQMMDRHLKQMVASRFVTSDPCSVFQEDCRTALGEGLGANTQNGVWLPEDLA